jgi:hypothetical protein
MDTGAESCDMPQQATVDTNCGFTTMSLHNSRAEILYTLAVVLRKLHVMHQLQIVINSEQARQKLIHILNELSQIVSDDYWPTMIATMVEKDVQILSNANVPLNNICTSHCPWLLQFVEHMDVQFINSVAGSLEVFMSSDHAGESKLQTRMETISLLILFVVAIVRGIKWKNETTSTTTEVQNLLVTDDQKFTERKTTVTTAAASGLENGTVHYVNNKTTSVVETNTETNESKSSETVEKKELTIKLLAVIKAICTSSQDGQPGE